MTTNPLSSPYSAKISAYLASQDLKINRLIGKGDQGRIYTLESTKTGKIEHVLKINPPGYFFKKNPFSDNQGAHLVKPIHHDGICSPTQLFYLTPSKELVLSPTPDSTYVGMIMPYIQGAPLREKWPEIIQKVERIFQFGIRYIEAINELSKHNIAHRDLHSRNILVNKDYKPTIIDPDFCKKQTLLSWEDYTQYLKHLSAMIRSSPDIDEGAKKFLESCLGTCRSLLLQDTFWKANASSELPELLKSFMQACVEHLDEIKAKNHKPLSRL